MLLLIVLVEKLTVWLQTNETHYPEEKCGSGSLILLQKTIEMKGIEFECINDPERVVLSFCFIHSENEKCKNRR